MDASLKTLLDRLETVTKRLEAIEGKVGKRTFVVDFDLLFSLLVCCRWRYGRRPRRQSLRRHREIGQFRRRKDSCGVFDCFFVRSHWDHTKKKSGDFGRSLFGL
jgi:hypothetical protein